jgi:hypothetical protein
MLDVHAPHTAPHSWRDFFIHIATIAVGLLIALGLEQAVEAIHRHHERMYLLNDLRQEAQVSALEIHENNRSYLVVERWYREALHAALRTPARNGYIVFTLPAPSTPTSGDPRPPTAVWSAAKASGLVSVLTREEIEDWERVDYFASSTQRDFESSQAVLKSVEAVCDHLGIDFTPGATIHTTLAGRDDLTRALSLVIGSLQSLRHDNDETLSATDSVLHGTHLLDSAKQAATTKENANAVEQP